MLALQLQVPGALISAAQRGGGALSQLQIVVGVGATGCRQLTRRVQPLLGVLTHRLQQREDRLRVLVILFQRRDLVGPVSGPRWQRQEQAVFGEREQVWQRLRILNCCWIRRADDRADGVEAHLAREDPEAAEEPLLRRDRMS